MSDNQPNSSSRHTLRLLAIYATLALFSLSNLHQATAQETDNVPQEKITPGRATSMSGGGNLSFSAFLEADRSYECAVFAGESSTEGDTPGRLEFGLRIEEIVKGPSSNVTANKRGAATPVVNADRNSSSNSSASRLTLTPESDGYHEFTTRSLSDDSGIFADGTGNLDLVISCNETTLYGGFNTNINNFNFLELTNTSNTEIVAKITATNFDGTVAVDKQSVTIPAGIRLDIDLHTPVGSGKYGTVKVTHDAALGSLTGYVSQYLGTQTGFTLSTSLPLATRERP